MKALVKNHSHTAVEEVAIPALDVMNNVLIQVKLSAICRTDINVSKGIMPSAKHLILGHEFYGEIANLHPNLKNTSLRVGDRVTIDPSQFGKRKNLMCGVDVDGAFAEFIKVPEHCVYPLPQDLSPRYCAFIEPIAASLAVLKANFTRDQIGCIYGKNRIATLTHKILMAKGYKNVTIHPEQNEILENHYDYMIETVAKTPDITKMIEALKIGGMLVLKSRQINPVEITINTLVKKDLTLKAVHYGDFQEAIDLLASGKLDLTDLIGNIYALDDFKTAFTDSQKNESKKCYLTL